MGSSIYSKIVNPRATPRGDRGPASAARMEALSCGSNTGHTQGHLKKRGVKDDAIRRRKVRACISQYRSIAEESSEQRAAALPPPALLRLTCVPSFSCPTTRGRITMPCLRSTSHPTLSKWSVRTSAHTMALNLQGGRKGRMGKGSRHQSKEKEKHGLHRLGGTRDSVALLTQRARSDSRCTRAGLR